MSEFRLPNEVKMIAMCAAHQFAHLEALFDELPTTVQTWPIDNGRKIINNHASLCTPWRASA
ncbi:hypothetical protein ACEPT7_22950 [Burkholderia ubonensis]|uniref:hypothetical protein n=1 Tax=Burkholderia ubonensis TaxID=101571 RepID=UPI00358FCB4E